VSDLELHQGGLHVTLRAWSFLHLGNAIALAFDQLAALILLVVCILRLGIIFFKNLV
jgi:hypothetical protein